MFQCCFVRLAFFGGKLFGALVELRGHVGGFFRWTTEGDEDLGQLGNFHKKNLIRKIKTQEAEKIPASCVAGSNAIHFTESLLTMVMLMMPMRLSGRSCGCVGVVAIFSSTSSPLINWPNVVY